MARTAGGLDTYIIPDNFVDEGRSVNGLFRTRYLAEGIVLGGICVLLSLLIPVSGLQNRLMVSTFCGAPGLCLGVLGLGGEPLSLALSHMVTWFRTRQVMLYDHTPRALADAPINRMMNRNDTGTQILTYVENLRQRRLQNRLSQQYVLGKNFRFVHDTDYTREYLDPESVSPEDLVEIVSEDDAPDEELFASAAFRVYLRHLREQERERPVAVELPDGDVDGLLSMLQYEQQPVAVMDPDRKNILDEDFWHGQNAKTDQRAGLFPHTGH